MNQPTNHPKQSTVCLLAIVMTLLGQAAPTGVNAITHSQEADEPRANEVAHSHASASLTAPANAARQFRAAEAYGRVPLGFEANTGQISDARVNFLARGDAYNLFLTSTEATFAFFKTQRVGPPSVNKKNAGSMRQRIYSQSLVENNQGAALRIIMRGANRSVKPKAADELPGRNNYFIGSDPEKWRVNVPTYSRVEYEGIYRGVDLVYYGALKHLEYDFIVAPGASYKDITIGFEGGDKVSLDDDGDLVIEIGGKKVYQRKPVAYQNVDGIQQPIAVRYVLNTHCDIGFEIGAYDASRSLVIDPVLSYSSYLGIAPINSVAVDQIGNAYVTGTLSNDFFGSVSDAFVMKLNREGTAVLYSTFLGGSDRMITEGIQNRAFDIAVDSNGNAYVTGSTNSKSFPTTPGAFQTTLPGNFAGRTSAFITKLNSNGDRLVYSTYLGGTESLSQSSGQAIAVDEAGSAYVTGSTNSFTFPLVNPIQSINRGGECSGGDVIFFCQSEAFVSKLNASGSALLYSTYLGGEGDDTGTGIAVDGAGSAYVVGTTSASNFSTTPASGFPTKNPLQPARGGSTDLFISKLSAAGNELIYSTLLGGSGGDSASGIAVDLAGNAYVTGRTSSTDFPTSPGALQAANESSSAFKSTDGGTTWKAINRGLPGSDVSFNQLVIDPINSLTLYANITGGLFKSTDAGNSWRFLASGIITSLVIDPTNSSTLYACLFFPPGGGGIQKSTDGGKTWSPTVSFLPPNIPFSMVIDPKVPSILYAAVQLLFGNRDGAGIFKSTDGGINWLQSGEGISLLPVSALALAPSKPRRLYSVSGGSIYRSNNRAKKWTLAQFFSTVFAANLTVDPLNPNILYIGNRDGVFKSTNGGQTWASTQLDANIGLLAIDPKNPSTIYAAGRDATNVHANFKSTDGGDSWKLLGRISDSFVATFAIDPNNTSIVYAGNFEQASSAHLGADAFVAKINPTGTALVYSTYLGGTGDDVARAVEVDAQGNAYLAGRTSSEDFPIKGALQPRKLGFAGSYDVFLTKLDPSGALIFSTYLGGSGNDDGRAMALDAAGALYIAGSTDSDDFPTLNPIQGTRNGSFVNGFVTKVVNAGSNEFGFSQARRSR